MRKLRLCYLTWLFVAASPGSQSFSAEEQATNDPFVAKWQAIDESSGVQSLIEIFTRGDRAFGKIVAVTDKHGKAVDPICTSCRGELKNAPVIGIVFISGLQKSGNKWVDGTVVDLRPGVLQGVMARCELELVDGKIKITGYLLGGLLRGSSTWVRAR